MTMNGDNKYSDISTTSVFLLLKNKYKVSLFVKNFILLFIFIITISCGVNKETAKQIYNKATSLEEKKEYSDAIDQYLNLVEYFPRDKLVPDALYHIGYCYFDSGELKKAFFYYRDVVYQYPNHKRAPESLYMICYIYDEYKNWNRLIVGTKKFIKIYPGHDLIADVYMWLGMSYTKINDDYSAIDTYLEFISKYPTNKKVWNAKAKLGTTYIWIKDYEKAEYQLNKIIKECSNKELIAISHYGKAVIKVETGKSDQAMKELEIVLHDYPDSGAIDLVKKLMKEINSQKI